MRGWVRVESYTDPPDALLQHHPWRLRPPKAGDADEGRPHAIRQGHWDGHALRVSLEGVADRDAAEALRGAEILIERAVLPAAAPREHYREDLLGFAVRNTEGVQLGTLQDFLAVPAGAVMVVRGEREYMVPAAPPHLRRVDTARREIEVDWPADF